MMPEALLKVLADGGIPVSADELLDILWLARNMPSGAAAPLARAAAWTDDTASPAAVGGRPDAGDPRDPGHRHHQTPGPSTSVSRPARNTAVDGAARTSTRSGGPDGTGGALHAADAAGHQETSPALPLRIPEAKVLTRDELPLSRALRPLKRSRPDPRAWELDERATVTAVAETGLLDPVLRPARIRWLDLVMLVDDGVSMLLWRRLVTEVRQLLERSGAFRTVRVHGLDTRSRHAPRISPRPFLDNDRGAPPTVNAAGAAGSTLLLVMSDGVGTAWHDGRMHTVLTRLARHGPTAVMHTLPEPLRENSGIHGRLWQVTTRRAGAANHTWQIRDPVLPPEVAPFDGLPVPVLEPSASVVEAWARLIGSTGASERLRLLAPLRPALPAAAWQGAQDAQDAGDDVLRFRAAATPGAYRLAAHVAAVAPVTVPVMRLIQDVLADHADTSHLAEVFLGGLMRRTDTGGDLTHPEHRVFDFPEDARRILLSTVPASELLRTSRALGTRLAELAGRAPDFAAWLAHGHGPGRVSAKRRPFTVADERLLRRLGLSAAPAPESSPPPFSQSGRSDVRGLVDRPGSPWKSLREDDPARLGPYTLFARNSVVHGPVAEYLAWPSPHDADPNRIALLRVPRSGDRAVDRELARTEVTALTRLIGLSAPRLWRLELDDEPWLAVDPHLRHASGQPARNLRALRRDGLLSETRFAQTGAKLAAAVARAHGKRIVHGALTPDRVLVTDQEVLVTDWATATIDGVPSRQRPEPDPDNDYLAPELEGFGPAQPTQASDVFALGVLLLTMRPGFADDDVQRALRQCVDEDPRARPSAAHVSRVLRAHANARAPRSSDGSPGYSPRTEAAAPRTLLISYAGVDRPWAEWMAWHLRETGHDVVLDVAEVSPGDAFARHLHSAAQAADAVIMLLSKAYAAPGWSAPGTGFFPSGHSVIPLAVENLAAEDLPASLRSVLLRNLSGLDEPAALAALLDAVNSAVPGPLPSFPPPLPPPAFRRPPVPTRLSVPGTWNVGRRNPDFTGREPALAHLRDVFASQDRRTVQVLHGQVGVGKTEIAAEYAHRFAGLYNVVWWIDAEDPESIPRQYAELGLDLGIRMPRRVIAATMPALFEHLRTRDDWLIVLDGMEEPETADRYLPDGPGHLLVTSRNPAWAEHARPTHLGVFTRLESVGFLTSRLGVTSEEAYLRAQELGDHPLALAQAVETRGTGVPNYDLPPVSQAVTRLGHEDPVAMNLLRMTAFLGPEPVPVAWVPGLLQQHALPGFLLDSPQPDTVLRLLARRGLADVEDDTFRIHRLTQALVRARSDEETVSGKAAAFLATIDVGRPDVPDAWPLWYLLTAHLTTGHLRAAERPELRPRLLRAVDYLMASGQHQSAHDLIVSLSRTWSGTPGADHPDSLLLSNALAVTLNYLGRHQEAYAVHEDNVTRSRRVRGDDHPDTLAAVHNLALSLHRLHRVPEAVPLLQDAHRRALRVLDPGHPVTERLTKTLIALLRLAGRQHEAEELLHGRD